MATNPQQPQPVDEASTAGRALPSIMVTDRHLREIAEDCWRAVAAANTPPFLFQRGRLLVDIIADDKGRPILRIVDKATLKGYLDRLANFVAVVGEDDTRPARPPGDVVADMMSAKELPLPVLSGIIEAPVFTSSGVLVTAPGYQPETSYYLRLPAGLAISPVPQEPTGADIAKAIILEDLLGDFPFVSDADRAHAVDALLLMPVRLRIRGPTPIHLVESPTPGSGKGLLVDVVTIPATGRGPAVMTAGRDEEEWRKRITAKLLQAPQVVLIDNVRSRLDSAALSAALTSETWEDRILGQSRTAAIPVTCLWLATANNPSLSLEVARRTIPIRLDAGVERPWQRSGFRHANLRRWARENRGQLIWATLTLVQAWIAAGKPPGQQVLGSYEAWAQVMGGILTVAGIPGFLGNLDRAYAEADAETTGWAEFCQAWREEYEGRAVTAELLFGLATSRRLLLHVWGGRTDHGGRTRFGIALGKMRDRVVGEFRISDADPDTHNKVRRYHLELRGVWGLAGGLAHENSASGDDAPGGTTEPQAAPSSVGASPRAPEAPQPPATPRNPPQ